MFTVSGSASGTAGTTNTGGGGGAGTYNNTSNSSGAAGGSGVVIISFPTTMRALASIGGGLTYTQYTSSGLYTYVFTAGTGSITF
jgi:hypothetical protein